jgi:hypothetical protein
VTQLVLRPPAAVRVRTPTRVRLTVDGRAQAPVRVGPLGLVTLPQAVRGRSFRLDVLDARFPTGTSARERQRRAVGIGEIAGAGVPTMRAPRRGIVRLACGVAAVRIGGRVVDLGGAVDRRALDAGRPLRLRACGAAPSLPARSVAITGLDRPLRVDALRLASAGTSIPAASTSASTAASTSAAAFTPASAAAASSTAASTPTVAPSGRVLDAGTPSPGSRRGARIAVDAPSWLVLGESFDQHWRATCDGRDLGTPSPLQGYANAWPVTRSCNDVDFTYGLQRAATAGYVISLVGCALLLLVALVGFRRRRRVADAARDPDAGPSPLRLPPADARGHLALVPALISIAVIGLAFGLRAGAVAAVVFALIAWRGIGDRALAVIAALLLGVGVPLTYIVVAVVEDEGHGGNATDFAANRLAAHWMALGALIALALILIRTLRTQRDQ